MNVSCEFYKNSTRVQTRPTSASVPPCVTRSATVPQFLSPVFPEISSLRWPSNLTSTWALKWLEKILFIFRYSCRRCRYQKLAQWLVIPSWLFSATSEEPLAFSWAPPSWPILRYLTSFGSSFGTRLQLRNANLRKAQLFIFIKFTS